MEDPETIEKHVPSNHSDSKGTSRGMNHLYSPSGSTSEIEVPCNEQKATAGDAESGKPAETGGRVDQDPNLVTWEGPDDPENPKKWSLKRRWLATLLVSLVALMTPIASSMIAPSEAQIDHDLNIHSSFVSKLVFSIFLLSFMIGPLFLAPLSEVYGRVIVLQLSNVWFLIFNLVCGFASNVGEILAFRLLAGVGACAPQTIGGGVLSDLWTSEERGFAVSIYTLAPILGPAMGPLIGAWVTERTTWRWSFWAVTIFGVSIQVLIYFTLAETFAPRILQRKAKKLRKETRNPRLHTAYETEDHRMSTLLKRSLVRVFVFLGTQPIIQFLSLYMALIYGVIYLMLSTFPSVWTNIYKESVGIGGLNYISLMVGFTIGAQVAGRMIDITYRRLKLRSKDGKGCPEFRVPPLVPGTGLISGGLFMFGWSTHAETHWIVPNIGAAIFGAGAIMTTAALQTYVIDSYPLYAASAVGATAVARSVTGFSFPLFGQYMFDALGQGWGNSVLAFAAIGIGYTGSFILWFFGGRLRKSSAWAAD